MWNRDRRYGNGRPGWPWRLRWLQRLDGRKWRLLRCRLGPAAVADALILHSISKRGATIRPAFPHSRDCHGSWGWNSGPQRAAMRLFTFLGLKPQAIRT